MTQIVDFKKREQGDSLYYSFFYEEKNYIMIYNLEEETVTYGETKFEGADLCVIDIKNEKKKELYSKTYDTFFIELTSEEGEKFKCALLMQLGFEGEEYGVYYDESKEQSPLYVFKIENKKVSEITDELKLRRLKKWFEERYHVI